MGIRGSTAALLATLVSGSPGLAHAKVTSAASNGFAIDQALTIAPPPARVYAALAQIGRWWSPVHTYSGSAANLSLDPRPGGCFCEALPGGGVQHMTVAYAKPGETLLLRGALGPLGGEGLEGALTFGLKPEGAGSRLSVGYVVGGYARKGADSWAAPVDGVLAEQLARLKRYVETGAPGEPMAR